MNVRRLMWIALLIAVGSILLMRHLQSQATKQKPTASAPAPATQAARPRSPQVSTSAAPTAPAIAEPAVPAVRETSRQTRWPVSEWSVHEVVLGSTDKSTGFKLQARLTNLGAAVSQIKLTDYFMTVHDKRRYEHDPDTYDEAVKKDPKLQGRYVLLKPTGSGRETTYPLATRRVTVISEGKCVKLNLSGPRWSAGEVQTEENEKGEIQSQSVTFSTRIYRNDEPFLLVRKTYMLRKGGYSISVRLEAVNLRKAGNVEFSLTQFSATGLPREGTRMDNRALTYGLYEGNEVEIETVPLKDAAKMTPGLSNAKKLGRSDGGEPVLWIGQTNKFFAALTYIIPKDAETLAAPQAKAEFFGAVMFEADKSKSPLAGMRMGSYELETGQSTDIRLDFFAGPKKRDLFSDTTLYRNLGYKGTLKTDSCCTMCAFEWLSLGMMWLLDFFYDNVTFHNYGLAIILLVILVRICLHPLMKKQQVSMMGMQKLQPEMAKIKEKYAKDKAKLNAEMMKLYKTQGATPLLGCLPMLLQFPILIALWTSINASVELRHAAFLPVWIIDLAAPDALIPFGTAFKIPLIHSVIGPIAGFNLLPLLLCVVMYLQMKFNPQMSGAATTPQQKSSQTMMKFMMPGMMLVFFYNAPAGLTLYFMTSTFAGLAEQYIIRKHIRQKEAAEAAVETKVAMPGKRFRGQKPKKPQGPFQIKR